MARKYVTKPKPTKPTRQSRASAAETDEWQHVARSGAARGDARSDTSADTEEQEHQEATLKDFRAHFGAKTATDAAEDGRAKLLTNEQLNALFKDTSLAESTLKVYKAHQNMVTNRGFPYSYRGLISLIMSKREGDLALCNATLLGIVTSFRHHRTASNMEPMSPLEAARLDMALGARKRIFPDANRVTGAMNHERTTIFNEFLREQDNLSDEQIQLFCDASWMLYGCALRIFQLRLLTTNSFTQMGKSNQDMSVRVRCKGSQGKRSRGEPDTEVKQVAPRCVADIQKIIKRRACNTELFGKAVFTEALRNLFSECVEACALQHAWPIECRFSGSHIFRHGAAQDAYEEGQRLNVQGGGLRLAMARTGHLSIKAAQQYALSDLERTEQTKRRELQQLKASERNKELLKISNNVRDEVDKLFESKDLSSLLAKRQKQGKSKNKELAAPATPAASPAGKKKPVAHVTIISTPKVIIKPVPPRTTPRKANNTLYSIVPPNFGERKLIVTPAILASRRALFDALKK